MDPGRTPRLREIHGAELAGADQHDADRAIFGGSRKQEAVEVHTVGNCRQTAYQFTVWKKDNEKMGEMDSATGAGLDARVRALTPGLDVLSLPACVLDADMRYRYVNDAYQEMSGKTRAECLGRTPDQVFQRTPRDERRTHLKRALAGESTVFNRRSLEGPGAGRWVRAHYVPLHDVAMSVVGVMVVLVDVQSLKDAEAALADRERQLSLIIDSVGFPITYVDRERVIRFANLPSCEWSGRTADAMIGQPIEAVMTPEVREAALPLIERALRGEPVTYEREALWPGRERRRIRGHMIPDRDSSGAVVGVLIVLLDIEQDHQLRRAVEAKEAQLRSFAQNIPGPIAVVDQNFRYVFANRMFEESRGLPLEKIVGRRVDEVLGAEASAEFFAPYVDRLKRGETCTHERLVGAPGEPERWHQVQLAPIMVPMEDGSRRFNGYYIVSSDIHDIKVAQEKLAAQEAQLRLYTDNIPDSVAYLDRNRRFLFANRHFAEQRGTTVDRIIGRTTEEVLGRELSTWIAERTQRVFDRGETATYERIVTLPSGERRWSHVKAVPHFGDDGAVVGMYVVSHDITDVKQAQEKLAASEEELRFFAENIPEAIAYMDLERGCTFVNNLYLESRGLTREFALGKFPDEVLSARRAGDAAPAPRARRGGRGDRLRALRAPALGRGALGAREGHAAARRDRTRARLLHRLHRHPRHQDHAGAARRQGTAAAPGDRLDPHADVLRGRPRPLPLRERRVPLVHRA